MKETQEQFMRTISSIDVPKRDDFMSRTAAQIAKQQQLESA